MLRSKLSEPRMAKISESDASACKTLAPASPGVCCNFHGLFAAHARPAFICGAPQSTGLIREAWLVTRIDRHRGQSQRLRSSAVTRRVGGAALGRGINSVREMAVRVIGSWYYTSELPAEEAATLRAAMVSKDCESLETWLKTSVHDADRKARLYALLRHAASRVGLRGSSC